MAEQYDPYCTSDDKARQACIAGAWDAYRGKFPDPLVVKPKQSNDNVKANRCSTIVDKGVSWLFGQDDFTIEVENDSAAQDKLDEVLKANKLMTLLAKYALFGGIAGHSFIKIVPSDPIPRLVVQNPEFITVQTDPDDMEVVLSYAITYCVVDAKGEKWDKRQIIKRINTDGIPSLAINQNRDDTWETTTFMRKANTQGGWVQMGEPEPWSYWWPPIVGNQNLIDPSQYWGKPDLTDDLIQMNRALQFVESNTSRILKWHAHPKTWIKGANASQIDVSADGVIGLTSPDAAIGNLEMISDLSSSQSFAEVLRTNMDECSRVPAVSTGRMADSMRGNQISGIAVKLLFQPLEEKTKSKQQLYGEMIEELCRRILDLLGLGYDHEITIHWPNLLPTDDVTDAQRAMFLDQTGLASKQTLSTELGYDWAHEKEQMDEEASDAASSFAQGAGMPPPPNMPLDQNAPVSAPAGQQQPAGVGAE